MGYDGQRSLGVLAPVSHGVHETRKAIVISDRNLPDLGPNQDSQRFAVIGCTTSEDDSDAPIRLPIRGLDPGMFR